ncbi:Uncharacterised protein [Klebsiella michiganensis]|nr:Uncharacterised protein [Klebsiella michiganensis]
MPPRASPGGIFYVLSGYGLEVIRGPPRPGRDRAMHRKSAAYGLTMRQKARQPLLQNLIFAAQARVLVQQR